MSQDYAITLAEALHPLSRQNRDRLRHSVMAGCFCCKAKFPADDITRWTDDSVTARCPNCGTDAVLGDCDVVITPVVLEAMYQRWFGHA